MQVQQQKHVMLVSDGITDRFVFYTVNRRYFLFSQQLVKRNLWLLLFHSKAHFAMPLPSLNPTSKKEVSLSLADQALTHLSRDVGPKISNEVHSKTQLA